MNTLGPDEVRVITIHLDPTSAKALRCVCKWLSEVPKLSEKRYWFTNCVYCGVRLKAQRPGDRSSVFRKTYLMWNINLECGCRCHRDCYVVATENHKCTNYRHQTLLPGRYLPSPLVPVIKGNSSFISGFNKWLLFWRRHVTDLRINAATNEIRRTLTLSGVHSERAVVREWLKDSEYVDRVIRNLFVDYKQLAQELMN